MNFYHSMPSGEFIDYLRDVAIKAGGRPAVIDAIDRLQDADKWELEAEELGGTLHDLRENFNGMRDILDRLTRVIAQVINSVDPDMVNITDLEPLQSEALELLKETPEQAT